jgi:hypothetical protein
MIGIIMSSQRPVIKGIPLNTGIKTLTRATVRPMAMIPMGRNLYFAMVLLVPKTIALRKSPMEAKSPPMKPPPGELCPRNRRKSEKTIKSGSKSLMAVSKIAVRIFTTPLLI